VGDDSVKNFVDKAIKEGTLDEEYVRTVSIGENSSSSYWASTQLSEEERNKRISNFVKKLLGNKDFASSGDEE